MRLQTLLDTRVNDAIEYFPELRVSLEKGGLRVKARSPIFAEFLGRSASTPFSAAKGPWAGVPFLLPKAHYSEVYIDPNGNLFGSNMDSGEQVANVAWLACKDLATGVDVLIKHPIGLNDMENYFTSACAQLQSLYVNHIRTREFTAVLREVFEGTK